MQCLWHIIKDFFHHRNSMKDRVEALPLPLEALGSEVGTKNVHERTLRVATLWVVWSVSCCHPAGGEKADWMMSLWEVGSLSPGEWEGQLEAGHTATLTGNSQNPEDSLFCRWTLPGTRCVDLLLRTPCTLLRLALTGWRKRPESRTGIFPLNIWFP